MGAGFPMTDFSQPCGSSTHLHVNEMRLLTFYVKLSSFRRRSQPPTPKWPTSSDCLTLPRVWISLGIWGNWIWSPSAVENVLIIKVPYTWGRHLTWWCTYLLYAGRIYIWGQFSNSVSISSEAQKLLSNYFFFLSIQYFKVFLLNFLFLIKIFWAGLLSSLLLLNQRCFSFVRRWGGGGKKKRPVNTRNKNGWVKLSVFFSVLWNNFVGTPHKRSAVRLTWPNLFQATQQFVTLNSESIS